MKDEKDSQIKYLNSLIFCQQFWQRSKFAGIHDIKIVFPLSCKTKIFDLLDNTEVALPSDDKW